MARIKDETKERRKERLWLLIRQHNGVRQSELAELSGFESRTVYNYLTELELEAKVYKEGVLWHSTPYQDTQLRRFEMQAEEAFTLYLAARLFVKQTDRRNEYAETALSRLAEVLRSDIPISPDIQAAAQKLSERKEQAGYQDIFQTVVRAYLQRRKLALTYSPARGKAFKTNFSVYLIEPSAIGLSTYIIGHSSIVNDLRSFKMNRIEAADIQQNEAYAIPEEFPGLSIFDTAWSIITGEETTRILLRFSPQVADRVLETNWHPSQGFAWDEEEPGHLRWWVDIADTTDMLPWIRGWGKDVEVLAPDHLRETVKSHIRHAANQYQIMTQAADLTTRLLRLWGKTSKYTELFHPAIYHMFDVAHIAQQLLSSRATPRWRNVLAQTLNTDAETLHEWLPYLIALHDMGKLSPPFQKLNIKQRQRLEAEGFDFGRDGETQHHTTVGRLLLNNYTAHWPPNLRHAFLDMVSGHHGTYRPEARQDQGRFDYIQESNEWDTLRQHAMQLLESYLCQQWPDPLPVPVNVSAAIAALNGFCILCDWLGSDGAYFKPEPAMPLPEYILHSRKKALARVEDAGLFHTAVSQAPTTFTKLFHDFTAPPRPLQQAIEQIPNQLLAQPTLTIIEAPTGEGKTEAALLLARRIAAERGTDEMYIALPTTATSNAMYGRITTHLEKRLGLKTDVQLIHGQSFLKEDDIEVDPLLNEENEEPAAENWFAPKKKALLAPVGVGTVDQAELSALNVRHNALRLIGLAGKTIILDEVHAYDTYMTTIIKRMLNWLSALGSSVILLSATLPKAKRRELMLAFASDVDEAEVNLDTYPNLLSVATGQPPYTPNKPITVFQPNKQIHLGTLALTDEQAQEKANWLLEQVKDGGCVCWITNTVSRAQAIFKQLQHVGDIDLNLLHSRFPLAQRQAIETDILQKYGKPGQDVNRPQRGIVVGTQVLEQSLDLDFDLMVTDLASIDLILQRAGRLHRHQRDLAERGTHKEPRLFINLLRGKADQAIYSDYILQMTERALQARTTFSLPTDYRLLVEAVYTEKEPSKQDGALYTAWRKFDDKAYDLEVEAHTRLTDEPDANYPFYQNAKLKGFLEDEDSSAWIAAQTRWSERETITVIPLVQNGQSVVVAEDREKIDVSLMAKASRDHQLHLLRHTCPGVKCRKSR